MSIQLHPHTRDLTITIDSPTFEAADAARLDADLDQLDPQPIQSVEIDLCRVDSIDSRGVGALFKLKQRFVDANADCRLALRNAGPKVSSVVNLLRLDRIFQVNN